jgi:unsaturated rhamnogalacturonyl hydrolase
MNRNADEHSHSLGIQMKIFRLLVFVLTVAALLGGASCASIAQERPLSEGAANAAIARWPDGRFTAGSARWNYELGTLLEGMDAAWFNTADARYYNYIKHSVDQFVEADGSIPTWKLEEYQLDSILLGRQLLLLYGVTHDARYAKAASLLYEQLLHQPRTASGGFWHKQRYPNQMWQDGLYMAEPFYAEYAVTFHYPGALNDITHQFVLIYEHTHDAKTGLLYHGWDESKQQRWADKQTGLSSQFWARAMGWQMMALVDTLAWYPKDDPGRKQLIGQLNQEAAAITRYQDSATGLWYQVLDKGREKGDYLESSASCMFIYALARGVREGYLPQSYLVTAERGYKGILSRFIQVGQGDLISLTGTVKSAGLGGDPYRDGSYAYYIGEKTASDDPKGVGALILAGVEMENAANAKLGRGDTVLLDAWYNSQKRTDLSGQQVYFHYKWNDQNSSGYSFFEHIFKNYGSKTDMLYTAPTLTQLRQTQIYMIVSPDIPAKNPSPHYMQSEDAAQIAKWVKDGGVLMIFENDPGNADLEHMNLLSDRFGIHYNSVLRNAVEGNMFEMGKVDIAKGGLIFHDAHAAYMKEICTITATFPATELLRDKGDILMAAAKYGKGTVFATVDPWLYNEYTDGRKLPASYDNYAAGKELVRWILTQVPHVPVKSKFVTPNK